MANRAFRIAATMRRQGKTRDEIETGLRNAWVSYCVVTEALHVHDRVIARTVDEGRKKTTKRRGFKRTPSKREIERARFKLKDEVAKHGAKSDFVRHTVRAGGAAFHLALAAISIAFRPRGR